MAIFNDINPATTSGTALAGILNSFKDSVASGFIGATRPTNLQAGGNWIDNSTVGTDDLIKYKYFDGTDDILIFTVNVDTNAVSVAGVDLSAIEGDIADLEADMATVLADITTLQSDVSDLSTGLTTTQGEVDAVETALAAHEADTTNVHGIVDTADLLTTSNTKTVTNKDIDGGTASNTSRITVPKNTKANLDALTRKVGTIVYATDEEKFYYDDGTELVEVGSGTGAGDGGKNYFLNRSFSEELEGLKSYLEVSAPAVGFFDGGGSGNIAASAFTSLGIADGTPAVIYGDIAPPSSSSIIGKVVYVKNFSTFIGFSLTPGGSTVAFTDTNDKGNYTVRFYYATPNQTAHMVASTNTSTGRMLNDGSLQIAFTDGGGVATNEGFEIETKVFDAEDYEEVKWIEVDIDASSANYVAGNMVFKAIDLTNGKQIPLYDGYLIQKTKRGYLVPVYALNTSTQVLVSVHMISDTAVGNWTIQAGIWKFRVDAPPAPGVFERSEEINLAGNGFTGGIIRVSKVGRQVTITGLTTITHSSGASPGSNPGTIPEWARPAITVPNSYYWDGGTRLQVSISPAGAISFAYNAARTDAGASFSPMVSYNVASSEAALIPASEFLYKGAQSSYTTVSGQTIPNSSTAILNFDSKIYDRLNNVTTGASWNFTSKVRDFYTVSAQVEWAVMASQAGSIWALLLYKNGVEVAVLDEKSPLNTTVSQRLTLHGSYDLELLPGDYVDVRVFQNDGGGRGISTGVGRNYISVKQNFDLRVFSQAGPVQNIQTTNISARKAITSVTTTPSVFTQVTGLTLTRDDIGEWDATNQQWVAKESDKYEFSLFAFYAANATGIRGMAIFCVDNSTYYYYDVKPAVSGVDSWFNQTIEIEVIAGYRYRLHYFQNSGAGLNLTINSLSITRKVSNARVTGALGQTLKSVTTSPKVPGATGRYHAMTGGMIPLTPGLWELDCAAAFLNNGTSPTYQSLSVGIYAANGADSGTQPTSLSTVVTILSAGPSFFFYGSTGTFADTPVLPGPRMRVRVTTNTNVYVVPYSAQTASGNASITAYLNAEYLGPG